MYDSLLEWFVQKVILFQSGAAFSQDSIILQAVTPGSINVKALLSISDPNSLSSVSSGLSSAMSSGSESIAGVVISGSAEATLPVT